VSGIAGLSPYRSRTCSAPPPQAANRNDRKNEAPKYRIGARLLFRAQIDASTAKSWVD
jgi:hypothetical protein